MKRTALWAAALLSCIFLTACGGKEEEVTWQGVPPGMEDLSAITERTEYYDLDVESEPLFDLGLWEQNPQDTYVKNHISMGGTGYLPVGTQFLQGEPVQLWAHVSSGTSDIYLYRKDGSGELMLQDIPARFIRSSPAYRWYLDREGNFYCIQNAHYVYAGESLKNGQRFDAFIAKILPSGEILYETPLPSNLDIIQDICQPENGKIYLLLQENADEGQLLAEIDPATGNILPDSQMEIPYDYELHLGSVGDSPCVTGANEGNRGIEKADLADQSLDPILYFTGTSYGWHSKLTLWDYRVLEDHSIELLWTDHNGQDCFLERLRMEKVEKIPLVCRGIFYNDYWLTERVAQFNQKNSEYQLILEDCGSRNDIEDFARLTSIQVGAGKGPDILCGAFLQDYIGGMLDKGALEELSPYLEASGIREEDYFPFTFSNWQQGEGIYGLSFRQSVKGYLMAEAVLGSRETPDIQTLADALLSWEGNDVWQKGLDSGQVLESFLEGTDSLWGMVDWEESRCDFNTPLFGKLLEAARRYGDDGRKELEASIRESMPFYDVIHFKGQAEREEEGQVLCGVLFDEGCYPATYSYYTMAINANSRHKEAAWEFISFMIGEEAQSSSFEWHIAPVHKKSFETWMQDKIIYELTTKHMKDGLLNTPAYYGSDTSEEKQAEYRKALEEARPMPMRTAPILTIILEEAEDYFNGSKSTEEIIRIINNRVQLYLNERDLSAD